MSSEARHAVERADLRAALEAALARHFGTRRRVRQLRRRPSAYASSCAMENLAVDLDRGQKLRLVFKNLGPASLLPAAQQVRPGFLYEPRREIHIYEKILDSHRHGTALCYGSVQSAALERYWLFLERVPGPLLWQVGRRETWEDAARWLAQLHSEFEAAESNGPSSKGPDRFACLVRYDPESYRLWLVRAEAFLRRRGRFPSEACRKFRRLAGRYDRLIARLTALPTTFIHGEFYPSNIIVGGTNKARRICPVDWELAGIGPGVMDLAALTAGEWSADDRLRMIAAYREALAPERGERPLLAELVEAVECGQLHECVRWLGWAADWSPPALHARNWLREALRLAEKLGL